MITRLITRARLVGTRWPSGAIQSRRGLCLARGAEVDGVAASMI